MFIFSLVFYLRPWQIVCVRNVLEIIKPYRLLYLIIFLQARSRTLISFLGTWSNPVKLNAPQVFRNNEFNWHVFHFVFYVFIFGLKCCYSFENWLQWCRLSTFSDSLSIVTTMKRLLTLKLKFKYINEVLWLFLFFWNFKNFIIKLLE